MKETTGLIRTLSLWSLGRPYNLEWYGIHNLMELFFSLPIKSLFMEARTSWQNLLKSKSIFLPRLASMNSSILELYSLRFMTTTVFPLILRTRCSMLRYMFQRRKMNLKFLKWFHTVHAAYSIKLFEKFRFSFSSFVFPLPPKNFHFLFLHRSRHIFPSLRKFISLHAIYQSS